MSPDGARLVIDTELADSMYDVKGKVQERNGSPPDTQQLFQAGEEDPINDRRLVGSLRSTEFFLLLDRPGILREIRLQLEANGPTERNTAAQVTLVDVPGFDGDYTSAAVEVTIEEVLAPFRAACGAAIAPSRAEWGLLRAGVVRLLESLRQQVAESVSRTECQQVEVMALWMDLERTRPAAARAAARAARRWRSHRAAQTYHPRLSKTQRRRRPSYAY
jgi:hypothetical protein